MPNRGKRNETAYINFTLDEIVRIRSEKKEYVAKNIFENTKKLFNLDIAINKEIILNKIKKII